MKKKILLILSMVALFVCLFAFSVSAEVTTYDDAPQKTNIQVTTDDVVVFDDGFSCPSGYIFKDSATISGGNAASIQYALDFTYINGKMEEKTYAFANIVELDIPQGITKIGDRVFQDVTTIKKVSVPNTVTSMGVAFAQNATGLEECVFEHNENSGLTYLPTYVLYNTGVKAFSMPDCITEIRGEANFGSCDNLEAVYLSKNLTTWSSGGGGRRTATFDDCYNVYFVNKPFTTSDTAEEKPTVYYFPANLETMSNQCIFRECHSLNDVLVFGEKFTSAPNEYLFQSGPANKIVFLGDMTTVSTKYWGKTTHIYFANENDVDSSCVTFSGGKTTVFCNAKDNTEHLYLINEKFEADCENPAKTQTRCFCGTIGETVETGEAKGHDCDYINGKATVLAIVYDNYSATGTKTVKCGNCGNDIKCEALALFTCVGYSAPENGNGGIVIGYTVNKKAITEYETVTDSTLKYGVFAVSKNKLKDNDVFANGEASDGVIAAEIKTDHVAFELKITGFETTEQKTTKLAVGAYVEVTKGETTSYSYMQYADASEGEKYHFITFDEAVELANKA